MSVTLARTLEAVHQDIQQAKAEGRTVERIEMHPVAWADIVATTTGVWSASRLGRYLFGYPVTMDETLTMRVRIVSRETS